MVDPVPLAAADNAGGRREFLIAAGPAVLVVALGLGFLAMIPGVLPSAGSQDPNRLTTVLSRTIETDGIEAAAAEYRSLRAQRFPRLQESESDANRLGYALLRKGQTANAIVILQLNVETHPGSANVYDSLGEAYLTAGNRPLAIANYEKALAIAPKMKSALSAIEDLTGRKRPPYRPLLLFHILNGLLGIMSGGAAIVLRKGSRRHEWAGRVFVVSMLSMSGSAAYIAFTDPDGSPINVLMGLLTFYLVSTAWLTARRTRPQTGLVDWIGLAAIVGVSVGLLNYGFVAANRESGTIEGVPAGVFFAFSAIALLAAMLDVRMIRRGGVSGAQRLTRHLWRMNTALFIAVSSFFQGQPQLFPVAVRNSGVLAVPTLLVILSLGYWLFRVNGFRRPVVASKPQPVVREAVAR